MVLRPGSPLRKWTGPLPAGCTLASDTRPPHTYRVEVDRPARGVIGEQDTPYAVPIYLDGSWGRFVLQALLSLVGDCIQFRPRHLDAFIFSEVGVVAEMGLKGGEASQTVKGGPVLPLEMLLEVIDGVDLEAETVPVLGVVVLPEWTG